MAQVTPLPLIPDSADDVAALLDSLLSDRDFLLNVPQVCCLRCINRLPNDVIVLLNINEEHEGERLVHET